MRGFLVTTALIAATTFAATSSYANEELIKLSQDAKQWVMQAGNYANTRYSTLKQITADNVGKLQVSWTFSTGVLRGHEGAPLVVGDMMYLHGPFPNPVYALNLADDNKIVWKYEPVQDPNVIPVMCCDTVNRGLAYADGKIFLSQADTTLVALDAKTGKVLWSQKNGDPSKGETSTAAPHVIKDKVLVGISGGEFGVRGSVTAYDIKTGQRAWRGYSDGPRQRHVDRSGEDDLPWQARRSRIRAPARGRAISGRSGAAAPGAGTPTIPNLTSSTMAPETHPRGIRSSGPATTNGRWQSGRATSIPAPSAGSIR